MRGWSKILTYSLRGIIDGLKARRVGYFPVPPILKSVSDGAQMEIVAKGKMQKFSPGDRVRVISYGSIAWIHKEELEKWERMSPGFKAKMKVLSKDGNIIAYDPMPELVGKEGIVDGSYHDLYGGEEESKYHKYAVNGIPKKHAWYNEQQLELIKDDKP